MSLLISAVLIGGWAIYANILNLPLESLYTVGTLLQRNV